VSSSGFKIPNDENGINMITRKKCDKNGNSREKIIKSEEWRIDRGGQVANNNLF
jgi:hypothetical protein